MKKLLSVLLVMALTLSLFAGFSVNAAPAKWDGTVATAFAGGFGTKEDPYQISNGAELAYFAAEVRRGREFFVDREEPTEDTIVYVVLTADIDLNSLPFSSIGYDRSGYLRYFKGCFDGRGHSITGFTTTDAGLFGGTGDWGISSPERDNGKIMNLHVFGTVTNSDAVYTGGLIGRMQGGTLLNCSFTGTVSREASENMAWVGGLVGQCENGLIADCVSAATVTGGNKTGGILGGAEYFTPAIRSCVNKGAVTGTEAVGGIVGQMRNSEDAPNPVVNCANTAAVTAQNPVGYAFEGTVGGIAGYGVGSILNCYNTGDIVAEIALERGKLGGIAGQGDMIQNCYNAGAIRCTLAAGASVPDDVFVGAICGAAYPFDSESEEQLSDHYESNAFRQEAGFNESHPAFYASGASGYEASNVGATAMTATQMAAQTFVDALNAWIAAQPDGKYLVWRAGTPYPQLVVKGEIQNGAGSIDTGEGIVSVSGAAALQNGDLLDVMALKPYDFGYALISDSMKTLSNIIFPFDIRLLRNGQPITDTGEMTISITVPVGVADPKIAYVSEAGEVSILESTLSGGVLSFTTTHNSYYVLYEAPIALTEGVVPEAGKTYTISSAEEFKNLAVVVNNGNSCKDAFFVQTKDIVLNDGIFTADEKNALLYNGSKPSGDNQPEAWTAIGILNKPFSGTFDGAHYTISGLYIAGGYNTGMFGACSDAIIRNVKVKNAFVKGNAFVGGIVGVNNSSKYGNRRGLVTGCSFDGFVVATEYVGGIIGAAQGARVSDCYNAGAITAKYSVGGVAGFTYAEIANCYNTGAVTATSMYTTGILSGNSLCGGIVGDTRAKSVSYATNSSIRNCYNIGTVSGTVAGALIGYNANTETEPLVNSYYPSTLSAGGLGTPLTEEEMKADDFVLRLNDIAAADGTGSFIGDVQENGGYPVLRTFHTTHAFSSYQLSADKTTDTAECDYYNCGAMHQRAHIHSWGAWRDNGASGHIHSCDCEETQVEPHTGGTANCHAQALCSVCSAPYGELNAANHDGGTEIRGAVAATEETAGYTGDTYCLGCNTMLQAGTAIPPLSHTHSYTAVVTPPTCTEQGYTTHTCSCDESHVDTFIAPLGHAWDEGAVTIRPLSTTDGVMTYLCTRCGETKTDVIPATGKWNNPFVDVTAGKWYYSAVEFAVTNELFFGTSGTTFSPDGDMTRGMLVTVLWRLDGKAAPTGSNPFVDVHSGKYYTEAVIWAAENQIVNGVGNGKFDPDGKVTRAQMAAILFRYAGKKSYNTDKRADLSSFPDAGRISNFAKDALSWAIAEGLINGSDGKLLPTGNATRAQVAAILMRYVQNVVRQK